MSEGATPGRLRGAIPYPLVYAASWWRTRPVFDAACHNPFVLPAGRAAQTGERVRVVLFSGGRGSGALARQLVTNAGVALTIAINGYDDGASTGEVRRFLADSLGPSDFRKNASRLAAELESCSAALIELLDARLAMDATAADLQGTIAALGGGEVPRDERWHVLAERIDPSVRARVTDALRAFAAQLERQRTPFAFADCSLGNLVFAGIYLQCSRDFNRAVDQYAALVGLPPGLVENVTDGRNAWLVGLDADGRLLASEEEIVDSSRPNRVRDIFLVDRPLSDADRAAIAATPASAAASLEARAVSPVLNPRLAAKIESADLIIYAPGTQHSSLFPSYLTRGLNAAIAANLAAIKLLITNIQPDAEIAGSNAVEIIERAVYYLKEKGRLSTPTPCLITHYLLNDPGRVEAGKGYVPLGPLETMEDPRLVRIGNYEEGVTGRHDAVRVLAPYIDAIVSRGMRRRVAVLLHDAGSSNKVAETLLEMVRGGIERVAVDVTVYYASPGPLDERFAGSLPFSTRQLASESEFADAVRNGGFEYVALFESSGMYRGEDLVGLASYLIAGGFDAVWGSRRLSVRDIEESYRLRYDKKAFLGAVSYLGSHVLSLAYLTLYGRYISDTLSAVRAVRAADLLDTNVDLSRKDANHLLLSALLRRKAELVEIPVRFLPLAPERVKRTTPLDGLRALATIVWQRLSSPGSAAPPRERAPAEGRLSDSKRLP